MKKHILSAILLFLSLALSAQNDRLGANLFGITVTAVAGDTFEIEGNYNDPSGFTTGNDLAAGDLLWTAGLNPGDTCRVMEIYDIVTSFAGYVVFRVDANGQGVPSTQDSKLMRPTPDNGLVYIPPRGNEALLECISQYLSFQLDAGTGGGGIVNAEDVVFDDPSNVYVATQVEAALTEVAVNLGITDQVVTALQTLTGVTALATDLGTFTGSIIPNSQTIKAALQALETYTESLNASVFNIGSDVTDLQTLSGVAAGATTLGTFTGTTIPDGSDNKEALQALETAAESTEAIADAALTIATGHVSSDSDISTSNEGQLSVGVADANSAHIISNTAVGAPVEISGGTGITVTENIPLARITITNAGDLSNTNEGSLTVGAGTSTTSLIQSNTSGSTPVTLSAGSGVTLTESGNTITISASGGGGGLSDGDYGDIIVSGTGTVMTVDNDAITTAKIADNAVTSAKIATGAVGATQLASTAVTPGSYTYMSGTVDADGRLTAASSGTPPLTGTVGNDQIAYGASGALASNSSLIRTTSGIRFGTLRMEVGAGTNSAVFGNTAVAGTGNGYVAHGYRAGNSSTTGALWVAQGFDAGFSNTTGSGWVAQGNDAGRSNTTGGNWVAQGRSAGYSNIDGINWVAQGFQAAYSNISGFSFVAQGHNAARANTTGNYWVSQGAEAAENNTTGSNWVAQGYQAAENTTTGGDFVAVGFRAGQLTAAGGTDANFTNGVYIGAQTRVSANDATNETVIGRTAVGSGSNTVTLGNTSVTGTYLSRLFTRGTTTANRPVGVAGYIGYNTTWGGFDMHNGTAFRRFLGLPDATPTEGHIPVYTSGAWTTAAPATGTMSSWTLAADNASTLIEQGETTTHAGGTGIVTNLVGNTITTSFAQSEISAKSSLGADNFFLVYDVSDGTQWNIHRDTVRNAFIGPGTANRLAMFGAGNTLTNAPLESSTLLAQTQVTGFGLARGTTAEAPAATTAGRLRWNTTTGRPTISDGAVHQDVLIGTRISATIDFPSTAAHSTSTIDVSVSGLEFGQEVIITAPFGGYIFTGYANGALDEVEVTYHNTTSASVDLPSNTYIITVIK